ncbi:MAG: hypothetical protein R6U32_03715 [Candidatus Woesearchaeota archaeon]
MKRLLNSRNPEKTSRLKKCYNVRIEKAENNDLILFLPQDIVEVYNLQAGDIAVIEIINKKCFTIKKIRTIA